MELVAFHKNLLLRPKSDLQAVKLQLDLSQFSEQAPVKHDSAEILLCPPVSLLHSPTRIPLGAWEACADTVRDSMSF